jgi:hypothetical protein
MAVFELPGKVTITIATRCKQSEVERLNESVNSIVNNCSINEMETISKLIKDENVKAMALAWIAENLK